jgi:LysR family transcriptional regulator, nitrogen assimilation regulatory protein
MPERHEAGVEFKTLRYFVRVAEARSFSKASVHLRVAQPALSRQVQKLEAEVGMPLFVRAGHHLELTEAGRVLLDRAYPLLRQVSNTLDDVRASASDLGGTLAIGVSPAVSEFIAPLLMRECAERYPKLRLDFVEGFSRLIFEQLLSHGLMLCLMHNPPPHKAIDVHPLLIEAMYLVGPPARGLPKHGAKPRLEGLPFILPNEAHALRLLIERALGPDRLNVAVQTDGMITTRALVAAGHGYTILPYSAIHRQLQSGEVSATRLDDIDIPWTLSLACWRDQTSSGAVAAVLGILRDHFDHLAGGKLWGRAPANAAIKSVTKSAAKSTASPAARRRRATA